MIEIIRTAADHVGGPQKLADILGIKRQALYMWDQVPSKRVIPIENATGGKVTRQEMRPDLYPEDRAA